MNKTDIEYLDYTFNPVTMRCTPISESCKNCWHLKLCDRFKNNPNFIQDVRDIYAGEKSPVLFDKKLYELKKIIKPSRIGIQFMGDLFHESIPIEMHIKIFDRLKWHSGNTYILLTKRPQRMKEVFERLGGPLNNWWIGCTAESQEQADKRIPILLQIPAAVHFVSVEPMLGSVKLTYIDADTKGHKEYCQINALTGRHTDMGRPCPDIPKLDWVICGGESGAGARPMHPAWPRHLRDQCQSAGVPFFFKQWGEWAPRSKDFYMDDTKPKIRLTDEGENGQILGSKGSNDVWMGKIGKKKAGRLLDNQVWDQMPEVGK